MGCMQSVANKNKVAPVDTNFEVFTNVKAVIDHSPTVVDESSPIVLRYRTPFFRAHAQVIFPPIEKKEMWTIGWIQACDDMKFINQYGELGFSSWEIPALNSAKYSVVSDSDGISYPWYGNTTEIATVIGPTDEYLRLHLSMNDNFYPSVTWDVPVSEGTRSRLTHIMRDQSFITWLAAVNETSKEIFILNTVRWKFYLEIHIDPAKELGQRTLFVTPRYQQQPQIFNGTFEKKPVNISRFHNKNSNRNDHYSNFDHIPRSALVRPSANYAQTLLWFPTDDEPVVIIPPREKHKDKTELVFYDNTSKAIRGRDQASKRLSKYELIEMTELT